MDATVPNDQGRRRATRVASLLLLALACGAVRLAAQTLSAGTDGGVVRVRAQGLGLLTGQPLARLKDGHTVRVEMDLAALRTAGGAAAAHTRRTFILSYDLWEERFAVMEQGAPARAASHLTAAAAEAWCVEQLTLNPSDIARGNPAAQFWVVLEFRILDRDEAPAAEADSGFTLRALIDALSSRRRTDALERRVEAGPFRLRP